MSKINSVDNYIGTGNYNKLEDEPNKEYIYLFGSFDIVNSTYLKSTERAWAKVINDFYDKSFQHLEEFGFKFWKYVRDEILFYKIINKNDAESLKDMPQRVYEVMETVEEEIHGHFNNTKMYLSLKGVLWISKVRHASSSAQNKYLNDGNNTRGDYNYSLKINKAPKGHYEDSVSQLLVDFIGPDMDLGFRISKFAIKNKLIVSAELVKLMTELNDNDDSFVEENFEIFKLESLKGIWHNRKYPIIIFKPDGKDIDFEYDDEENLDRLATNRKHGNTNKIRINNLDKIFKEVGKEDEIKNYTIIISHTDENIIVANKASVTESPVDVHIAAILFNEKNEVLLMKRGNKKSSPEKYDFGCTNIEDGKPVIEALQNYYSGVGKDVIILRNKDTNKPIPIAMYEYEKNENKLINGILFVGKVTTLNKKHEVFGNYEKVSFHVVNEELKKLPLFDDSYENINIAYDYFNSHKESIS